MLDVFYRTSFGDGNWLQCRNDAEDGLTEEDATLFYAASLYLHALPAVYADSFVTSWDGCLNGQTSGFVVTLKIKQPCLFREVHLPSKWPGYETSATFLPPGIRGLLTARGSPAQYSLAD
jgi:hypothetical protein